MATTSYQRIAARNRVLEAALALQSSTAPEASPARALLKSKLMEAVAEHDEVVGKTSLGAATSAALTALAAQQALAPLAIQTHPTSAPGKWRTGSTGLAALGITEGHR